RPSQKLRKLNTALIIVGVFRGSTLRVPTPTTLKIGSGLRWQASVKTPVVTEVNVPPNVPCDDIVSSVVNLTPERFASGLLTWMKSPMPRTGGTGTVSSDAGTSGGGSGTCAAALPIKPNKHAPTAPNPTIRRSIM